MSPELIVEQADPQGHAALSLLRQAAIEARELYPELVPSDGTWPTNAPTPERGVYLVGFVDGTPVACGALRPIDARVAEVRRMFVLRSSRGHGFATAILSTLEKYASMFEYSVLRLETGDRQHAAIALYESYGFRRIAPFGSHADDPTSVCFEMRVPVATATRSTVLASLETEDGSHCIDFFLRRDGTFGFEQYRREHDGASGWQSLGKYAQLSFGSGQEALRAAKQHVTWLDQAEVWRW